MGPIPEGVLPRPTAARRRRNGMNAQQTELQRFRADIEYFQAHRDELARAHPDQWIAVYQQRLVGFAGGFEELLADLRARGVPPEHALVEHLTNADEILILPS
jgi:hypothetical protein